MSQVRNDKLLQTKLNKFVGAAAHPFHRGDGKHLNIMWNLRWDRITENGERMDRCSTDGDVEKFLKFCLERSGYTCRLYDGDYTAKAS